MLAFDLPSRDAREQFYRGLFDLGLLAIRAGERSVRFRPVLDITPAVVQDAVGLLREQCRRMRAKAA